MGRYVWLRWLQQVFRYRLNSKRRPEHRPRRFFPYLEALESRLTPNTYNVTSTADLAVGGTGISVNTSTGVINGGAGDGQVTLRSAVVAADAAGGSNTITLLAGTYTLSIQAPQTGKTSPDPTVGSLDVTDALTIMGAGSASTVIDGFQLDDKIFSFNPFDPTTGTSANPNGFAVSVSGLTLIHANNFNTFASGHGEGGGFDFDAGTATGGGSLSLNDVIVNNCQTFDGDGGGIALFDGGTVNITNSQIINNFAKSNTTDSFNGGGIFVVGGIPGTGTVTITNTTISGNSVTSSGGQGGGYFSGFSGSPNTIFHGDTITNNTAAADGGGIDTGGSSDVIDQGTLIDSNTATTGNGGGINSGSVNLSISNATITNNDASAGAAGGVFAVNGTVTMSDSRIVGNTSSSGGTAVDENSGATFTATNNWWGANSPAAGLFGSLPTASYTPYLVLTTMASASSLSPGQTGTLTASITTNSNSGTGFTVPDGTPVSFSSTPASLVTYSTPPTSLTSGTATANFTASTPGTGALNATVDSQSVTKSLTVTPTADLAVTKSGPSTNDAGTNITYKVTVTNNGPDDAANVLLTDTVPTGMTFVSETQNSGPTFARSNPSVGGTGTSTLSISSLANGASAVFTFVDKVAFSVANGTLLTNTAKVSSDATDPDTTNNSDTVTTTAANLADLVVTKTGPVTALPGDQVTYKLTVTNNGPTNAHSITVTDALPSPLTLFEVISSNNVDASTSTGHQVNATIATLAAGKTEVITALANLANNASPGDLVNTVTVTTATNDPDLSNNTSSITTTVVTQADLAVTKTGPTSAIAGANVTYTVTVTNNGPGDAQSVSLTDVVPANTTFVSTTTPAGWTRTDTTTVGGTGTLTFTIATLASGASGTFTFVDKANSGVTAGTTLSNTARASATNPDPTPGNNSATATTTVDPSADLVVTKTGPGTVTAGDQITYSVTVTNNGPDGAQNVSLTDAVPSNTTFVSATTPGGWTRTDSVTTGNTGTLSFTIATLAAGASATFTFIDKVSASAADSSTVTNTATASTTTTDPDHTNDSQTATTTVQTQADLSVTKSGPSTATAGKEITYQVTATNTGPSDAQGVVLTDAVPSNTTFVSATTPGGWTRTDSVTTGNTGTLSFTIATLAAGASATFTFIDKVSASAADSSTVTNTATASTTTTDPDHTNDSQTATTTVQTQADLSVTKSGPSTATAGKEITYQVTVTNTGPSDAQGVVLTDAVPSNTTFVSATTPGDWTRTDSVTTGNTGTLSFTIATLAAGASATFTFIDKVSASAGDGSTLANTATASTTTTDPDHTNDSQTATTTVQTQADLSVTKSGPSTATAGKEITYQVTATNTGPSDAQGVVLTDAVPSNTTFVSATTPGGWTRTDSVTTGNTGTLSFTIATLAAGASATFTFIDKVSASQGNNTTLSNTAKVSTDTTDPTSTNNSSTASTTVNTSADLAVTKTGPAFVTAGTNLTYTITVSNLGPSDAQNVSLTDTLPAGTTFVTQSQTSGTAFTLGNTGNSITDTITTLAAGASATFTFTAKANASNAEGTILSNTASVSTATTDPKSDNNSSTAPNTTVSAVVVGNFPGSGVKLFLGPNNWQSLMSPGDATLLVVDPAGNIYGEFPGHGVQKYDWQLAIWQQMTSVDASVLAAGGTAIPIVIADFPLYGVSQLLGPNNHAKSLTSLASTAHPDATLLAVDPAGNIYGEFPHYGVQKYITGMNWQQITPVDASILAAGKTTDSQVLIGEFPHYGIFQFIGPNNWNSFHTSDASLLAVDQVGDVFAALGNGVFAYHLPPIPPIPFIPPTPQLVTSTNASLLAVKTNGDLFADLAGIGIVHFKVPVPGGGMETVFTTHASVLAAAD